MSNDDAVDPAASEPAGVRAGVGRFFILINTFVGLPVFTIMCGLVASYIQYSIAYQDKIVARGAEELKATSETFNAISKKFAEAQMLQQMLFSDFSTAVDNHFNNAEQTLTAKHAQGIFSIYEKASNALLGAGEVMAYDAERYIDWASDLSSDSARKRPYTDPTTPATLRANDFDCEYYLPSFESSASEANKDTCAGGNTDQPREPLSQIAKVCPRKKSDTASPLLIDWYSSKHEVITMHYCFQALHDRLRKVRSWASQEETSPEAKAAFQAEREQMQSAIDNQSRRLSAFMSLGLNRIDAIQLRYRPISFRCQLPLFRPAHGCRPLALAQ